MRNLFQLIYRYHVFLVFLVLFTGSVLLALSGNRFQRAVSLGAANYLIGKIQQQRSELKEYVNLRAVNEELARANTGLRNAQSRNFIPLSDHFALINDSIHQRRFRYITAKVINSSTHHQRNLITLDRGTRHGIKPDMGVIYNGCMVGIVKEVSEHFAVVIPIINNTFKASVRLKGSGEFGLIRWDGRDPEVALVEDIPKHVNIEPGDTLVTTGYSAYFPSDMLVGTVLTEEIVEGDNFHTITVRIAAPFLKLQYVDVVENLLKSEQEQLENKTLNSGL